MMKNLQKMGGIAALYSAAALLFAMVGYLLIVGTLDVVDPVEKVAKIVDNQAFLYIITLIACVIWGIVMVPLTLALYERLKAGSPAIMQTATAIGLIWACIVIASGQVSNMGMATVVDLYSTDPNQAATVWLAIGPVADGLGSAGGEILGGLWMLLVSWAALRAGGLSRALNYLGALVGVAGLFSAIPVIGVPGTVIFGLGKMVWSLWLGIVMLRSGPSTAAAQKPFRLQGPTASRSIGEGSSHLTQYSDFGNLSHCIALRQSVTKRHLTLMLWDNFQKLLSIK